ncbi:YtxH-like protein [compost metagenome]
MSQENHENQTNNDVTPKAKKSKGWIVGAAVGSVVGSVAALLLAPKPGKEVRKDIAVGARKAGEKTSEVAQKVGEQSVQIAGKVKNTAEGLVQDFQNWRSGKEEPVVEVSSENTEEAPVLLGVADEVAPAAEEVVADTEEVKEEK